MRTMLLRSVGKTRSLTASVAMLEALILGWPGDPDIANFVDEAAGSTFPELRLIGAFGHAEAGRKTDPDRLEAFKARHFWNDVSYPYRELAGAMLLKHWADDDALLPSAMARADGEYGSPWELELALRYVLQSSMDRPETRRFVLRQLADKYPFNSMHGRRAWSRVGEFAVADPTIRAAAIAHWADPRHRLIGMHMLADYAEAAPDDQLAEILIGCMDSEKGMDRYWALDALLRGWGADHQLLQPVIDALAKESDDRLADVVALLPRALCDPDQARGRVLSIARQQGVRRDMVATAFAEAGSDHTDEEAVAAILADGGSAAPAFYPGPTLFRTFAKHPKVRALAIQSLNGAEPALAAIAEGYADDPEIVDALFALATPLRTELRSQIVEFAAAGSAGTVLEDVIADGIKEADPDLRIRMTILHLRALTDPAAISQAKELLVDEARAVGSFHHTRRATALAGFVTFGNAEVLAEMQDYNGPLALETGSPLDSMPSLERLICENYAHLVAAFGEELPNRFGRGDHGSKLAEILSAAPSASPDARAAFLSMAEDGTMPLTTTALRSLAAERPRSALLLERCWQALAQTGGGNARPVACAEVALILAAEFPGDPAVRAELEGAFQNSPHTLTAIALSVFSPESEVLPLPSASEDLRHFGDLIAAVYVVGARGDTSAFLQVLDAMVTRDLHSTFDGQQIMNLAVSGRIQRDEELQARLTTRLATTAHPSLIGSNARQLATAGRLAPQGRVAVADSLARMIGDQRVPVAGYDAVGGRWRALRATLLDALHEEVE